MSRAGTAVRSTILGHRFDPRTWVWLRPVLTGPTLVELIDLHIHILPGLDDGPGDLADTKALASACISAGVDRVVATPHVNHRWGLQFPQTTEAVEETRLALEDAGLDLQVELGAEVALTTAVDLEPEQLQRYRMANGDWLLLEAPSQGPSTAIHSMIFSVMSQGHRVLLAHPERCQTFQEDLDLLASLVNGGVRTQVTAEALTGRFGRTAQRTAQRMFNRDLVHVVASDAHHATHRPPSLIPEIKSSGHGDLIQYLCHDMPAWILDGGEEPVRPDSGSKKKAGRGILGRLGFNA